MQSVALVYLFGLTFVRLDLKPSVLVFVGTFSRSSLSTNVMGSKIRSQEKSALNYMHKWVVCVPPCFISIDKRARAGLITSYRISSYLR